MTKFFCEGSVPEVANEGDAGIDLRYKGVESIKVEPGTLYKFHTGLYVEIPRGKCGIIFERSGLGTKGVTIHGRIIDSGYRGEIIVLLSCNSVCSYDTNTKEEKQWYPMDPIVINPGDRVAQMVIVDCYPQWERVDNLYNLSPSSRGKKGLGSSGK